MENRRLTLPALACNAAHGPDLDRYERESEVIGNDILR